MNKKKKIDKSKKLKKSRGNVKIFKKKYILKLLNQIMMKK